ncbi:MAG: DMT family transporter [Silvibacterium sp.]|nr:DMT family transporter [Silvibacterium sp.]
MLPDNSTKALNRFLLFTAAFLFSTGGAAIKGCTLSSWQVAGFRSGIAAITIWLLLPEARRGWTLRTFLISVAYAATLVLFVLATRLTTSANAVFLQATAPLYVLLLGPLLLHEPNRRADIVVMSAVAAGVVLLLTGYQQSFVTAPHPSRGNLLALATGFTWALTLTGLRWLGKTGGVESAGSVVVLGNAMAFAICLPMAVPVRHIDARDAGILLYLGIFQVGVAYIALTRGIRHVPALEAATLLLVEPVFNPIWAWLVHGERPGYLALFGGACILAATFGGTWWHARHAPAPMADSRSIE